MYSGAIIDEGGGGFPLFMFASPGSFLKNVGMVAVDAPVDLPSNVNIFEIALEDDLAEEPLLCSVPLEVL